MFVYLNGLCFIEIWLDYLRDSFLTWCEMAQLNMELERLDNLPILKEVGQN